MIRLLSQRQELVDDAYRMTTSWFTMFSDLVRRVNYSQWNPSATAYALTGTTDETTAATINALIGNTGSFRLTLGLSSTSSVNAKTVRVKLGSTTIQTFTLSNSTASQTAQLVMTGRAASSQFSIPTSLINCTSSGGIASTENISVNIAITVTLQLANSTETVTLENYILELEQV